METTREVANAIRKIPEFELVGDPEVMILSC
jgi:glutamate/tyrosine decarboxylase-like PLP-dependent enzyme